jgi:hypothetical protein
VTFADVLYALISVLDATVLLIWGALDLRKAHRSTDAHSAHEYRRDGLFLIVIGVIALLAYGIGHYRERLLDAEIATASKEAASANSSAAAATLSGKVIEAHEEVIRRDNLRLQLTVESERKKRQEVEAALQALKTVTQLSEEALSGSRPSFERLVRLSRGSSDLHERAAERVSYILRELAYYEQPPGIVFALELSATVDGKKVRLIEYPTRILFNLFSDESITNTTRFSLVNDICQKPVAEVDENALTVLRRSKYLPAVAATTTILRRLHANALPFMDADGWITYLVTHKGH